MTKNQLQSDTSTLIGVGIDVSKDNLMFCKKYAHGERIIFNVPNKKMEIRNVVKEIKKEKYEGRIVMESTGRYHLLSALELNRFNLDARVINPLMASKYFNHLLGK